MRLVYRFFFIILGAALIPLLLTSLWLLRYQSVAKKNALELHRGLADFAAQTVTSHIQNLNKRLAFTLDLQRIKRAVGMGFVEEFKVLQQVTNANPDFVLLSVLDLGGKETLKLADARIFPDPGYKDRSREDVFLEAKRTGRVVTGPVSLIDGTPVMNLVYPLEQAGYVYLTVSLRELWEKIKKQRVGLSGWIVLVDDSGRVLNGFEDAGEMDSEQLKALFSQGLRGTADNLLTSRGAWVGAFEKVQGFPWAALTLQPKQEAFLAAEQIRAGILAWVLLISLAALGLSYAMAARIAEPIEYLTLGAARVAQKDMSVAVPELGWGELKVLSRSFNQMMKELKVYYDLQVEKIIEEKTKVETLVYTIPEGIVMTNFNGEVLYINVPAMSILGIPTDTTLESQKRVFELVRHESLKDLLQKVLQKQVKVQEAEVQIEEPAGGGMKYYSTTATLVSTPNKQDLGVMLMMRDVTAEKELEKMKEEFFHAVAHDLRAPLAAIQSYTKLLERSFHPAPEVKEKGFFDAVYRSCDKLMLLVSDILDLAKMEAGEMPLSLSVLEVETFLKRVTEPLQPLAGEKGIQLVLEGVDSKLGTMQVDQRLMDRVITNLATNAIKFTPRGGKVAVGAGLLGMRELEIYVADSGPGIPKDQLESIFEKFKQLGGSQMRMGYGIGLSICKKVVELHKGAIWVESQVGRGSRFIFRIPRTQQ